MVKENSDIKNFYQLLFTDTSNDLSGHAEFCTIFLKLKNITRVPLAKKFQNTYSHCALTKLKYFVIIQCTKLEFFVTFPSTYQDTQTSKEHRYIKHVLTSL